MADLDLSSAKPFVPKSQRQSMEAPPGMVCDGDVCYFPGEGPDGPDAGNTSHGLDEAEDDGPPPLMGADPSELISAKSAEPVKKAREFPLPGMLKRITNLVDSDGKKVPAETVLSLPDKVVGLYMSAQWCPPCRQFSPILSEYLKSNSSNMTVIYVSMDRNEQMFLQNIQGKPLFAVPFTEEATRMGIASDLGVSTIPTLVILKPGTCEKISGAGRKAILEHMQGKGPNPVLEWKTGKCSVEESGGEFGMLGIIFGALRNWLPYIIAYFVYIYWVRPFFGMTDKQDKKAAKAVAKGMGMDTGDDDEDEDDYE